MLSFKKKLCHEICQNLLDLSAVFDTVDHNVLLSRLHSKCFNNFFKFFLFEKSFVSRIIRYSKLLTWFKVIPLFCTAHPVLRITLWHPRWRRFFPLAALARREQTRAAFAKLKLLFATIMRQIGWQFPDLLPLRGRRVVELLKCPGWGLDYGCCEACGTALRLSKCINEPVSGLGSLHVNMFTVTVVFCFIAFETFFDALSANFVPRGLSYPGNKVAYLRAIPARGPCSIWRKLKQRRRRR